MTRRLVSHVMAEDCHCRSCLFPRRRCLLRLDLHSNVVEEYRRNLDARTRVSEADHFRSVFLDCDASELGYLLVDLHAAKKEVNTIDVIVTTYRLPVVTAPIFMSSWHSLVFKIFQLSRNLQRPWQLALR